MLGPRAASFLVGASAPNVLQEGGQLGSNYLLNKKLLCTGLIYSINPFMIIVLVPV